MASRVDDTDTFGWTVSNTNQEPTFDQDLLAPHRGRRHHQPRRRRHRSRRRPLTYAATGLPGGLTIDTSTGLISGTLSGSGAGAHHVTVTVTRWRRRRRHRHLHAGR